MKATLATRTRNQKYFLSIRNVFLDLGSPKFDRAPSKVMKKIWVSLGIPLNHKSHGYAPFK